MHSKNNLNFLPLCITGPSLPNSSAMAEASDGRGVLLFGGCSTSSPCDSAIDRILELRAGANSWNILDTTLQHKRFSHTVIQLQQFLLKLINCMCIDNFYQKIFLDNIYHRYHFEDTYETFELLFYLNL